MKHLIILSVMLVSSVAFAGFGGSRSSGGSSSRSSFGGSRSSYSAPSRSYSAPSYSAPRSNFGGYRSSPGTVTVTRPAPPVVHNTTIVRGGYGGGGMSMWDWMLMDSMLHRNQQTVVVAPQAPVMNTDGTVMQRPLMVEQQAPPEHGFFYRLFKTLFLVSLFGLLIYIAYRVITHFVEGV